MNFQRFKVLALLMGLVFFITSLYPLDLSTADIDISGEGSAQSEVQAQLNELLGEEADAFLKARKASPQEPEYVKGRFILKLKTSEDDAKNTLRAPHTAPSFPPSVTALNEKYNVETPRGLFGRSLEKKRPHARARRLGLRDHWRDYTRSGGSRSESEREESSLGLSNVYLMNVPEHTDILKLTKAYEKDPSVEYAEPDYIFRLETTMNDPHFSDLWGLKQDKLNVEAAWNTAQGKGIVVAVLDSGLDYNHPDIWNNVWIDPLIVSDVNNDGVVDLYDVDKNHNKKVEADEIIPNMFGWDFVNDDKDPFDGNGHGTHVSGTIAAVGNNGIGIVGVAPKARIMTLKGLNDSGSGSTSGLAAGIVYAANHGADIISNSWGARSRQLSSPTLENAIRAAYNEGDGAVIVFSAGNSNDDVAFRSPQNMPETIVVAATDPQDRKAFFSNYGQPIDVAAPGVNILSLKSGGAHYNLKSGTSMAGPHVAGLAALILGKYPAYSVEQVRQAIRRGADKLGGFSFTQQFGYGRIRASNSVEITLPLEVSIRGTDAIAPNNTMAIHVRVRGAHLDNWKLEYAPQSSPDSWKLIQSSTLPEPSSSRPPPNWDLSNIVDGIYFLRVTAKNTSGFTFEDRRLVSFNRFKITEPSPANNLVRTEQVNIMGSSFLPNFSHYEVRIHKEDEVVEDSRIALVNNGKEPVIDGLLATWYTRGLRPDRYTIELISKSTDGAVDTERVGVLLDLTTHPGWPIKESGPYAPYALFKRHHLTAADINGDKKFNLLVTHWNQISIFDHHAETLPGWPQYIDPLNRAAFSFTGPTVGDLNGDGALDVAAFSTTGASKAISVWNADGTLLPDWPIRNIAGVSSLAIDDLDGDGQNELIVTQNGQDARVHVLDQYGRSLPGWPTQRLPSQHANARLSTTAIGDTNGDGAKEIVVATVNGPFELFLLSDKGDILPGWPVSVNHSGSPSSTANFYATPQPVMGNLDNNDRDTEIVINFPNGQIYAYQHEGSLITGWPQRVKVGTASPPAIGDLDGDGKMEVVVGEGYRRTIGPKHLYVFHSDGTVMNGWPVISPPNNTPTQWGFEAPVLADISGDGRTDVVVFNNHHLRIEAYHSDGTPVKDFPKPVDKPRYFHGYSKTPAVADFDGDGRFELAALKYRDLYVWDLEASAQGPQPWPMFQHDAAHTGSFDVEKRTSKPPVFTSISPRKVKENQTLSFTLQASDPNGDKVTISPVGKLPSGAKFTPSNNRFTWKPNYSQGGRWFRYQRQGRYRWRWVSSRPYQVKFIARDSTGLTDTLTVKITVQDVLRPPRFWNNHPPASKTIEAGKKLTFEARGFSLDGKRGRPSLTTKGLPSGARLDIRNSRGDRRRGWRVGIFRWTPTTSQVGNHQVRFVLRNGGGTATQMVTIQVTAPKVKPKIWYVWPWWGQKQDRDFYIICKNAFDSSASVQFKRGNRTYSSQILYRRPLWWNGWGYLKYRVPNIPKRWYRVQVRTNAGWSNTKWYRVRR